MRLHKIGSFTNTLFYFGLGRAFMGFASSFSFVGVMYLCTQWFPREKLAMLSGLTSGLGVLGAILAQSWLPKLKAEYGYNNIWIISIIAGIVVIAFIFKYIPKDKSSSEAKPQVGVCIVLSPANKPNSAAPSIRPTFARIILVVVRLLL